MINNLYREAILEHYREPLNFGKIDGADVRSRQTNPLCGDDISIWVKFGPSGQKSLSNGVINDISFFGKGCAICIASASMLTEYAKGRTKKQLTKFSQEDMLELLGIQVSETRKKCALLSLAVLQDCLRVDLEIRY